MRTQQEANDTTAEPPEVNKETLKLLVEQTSETPAEQVKLAASFDAKIVQIAAAGGILIGLTAASVPENSDVPWWLILLAVFPYLAIVISTVYCLWVRKFQVADDPKTLWETLWDVSPDDARHAIIERLADGYETNEAHLQSKRVALTVALVGLALEVVLVATALAVALA